MRAWIRSLLRPQAYAWLAGQNPALELRQLGQWLRKVGEHQPNVAMSPDKLSPSRPPCG
jgi:hypothetical protein